MTELEHQIDPALAGAIALQIKSAAPDAAVRARMRERVLQSASLRVKRRDEGSWQPLMPGISVKTLRRDAQAGTQTSLWRLDAAAVIPPHPHRYEEECLVLEGSVIHAGSEFLAGDYLLVPAGGEHGEFTTSQGALLLIRSELLPPGNS